MERIWKENGKEYVKNIYWIFKEYVMKMERIWKGYISR